MGAGPRFVGRAAELAELAAVLARADVSAAPTVGAIVAIVGEPGVGKTALVATATTGRRVAWARARDGGGVPPLWLWEQVITDLGRSMPRRRRAGATGVDRFRTFDDLARRLIEQHRTEPVTIVLDDLQWADEESLAFVDFLAPDAERHGIVVLATVRRGELSSLPRGALVIELGGLSPDDVGRVLTPPPGHDGIDADLVDAVWRHTGGNPFFIGEVDRLLRSSGREADPTYWRSIVPEGVRSVLDRRFARLPERVERTLLAAAELGETIDPPVLAVVLDRPLDDVLDDLGAATAAGVVRNDVAATPMFGHSLVREAARARLPASERRRLNGRAADALQARYGDRAVARIAQHLGQADDPAAGAWAARAGDAAYAASMYAEAAAWFERCLEHGGDGREPALRVRRAEALARCGRAAEAEVELLSISRWARAADDALTFGRAVLGIGSIGGGFEVRQLDPGQQALVAEAVERVGDRDDALRATLMARLSVAISLDGDHDERARLAVEAIALARRSGDDSAVAAALGAWCDAFAGPAHIDDRIDAATEMLVIAQRLGDAEVELLARRLAIVATLEAADVALAERHGAAFSALADRLRLPQFTWFARLIEGMLAHLHGDLDSAARLAAEASELGRRAGSDNARMLADGSLVPIVDRDRGDPGYIDRMISVNSGIPEVNRGMDVIAPFQLYTVGHGGAAGDVAAGVPGWAAMWRSTGLHDGLNLLLGFQLARGAALTGDRALIDETERALAPYADRLVLDGTASVCHGPVSAALGALAAARGDVELAEQRYEQALATCARIRAPLLRSHFERARASHAMPAASPAGRRTGPRHGTLRREGDVWLVAFGGDEVRLRHSKGLGDLAMLLARPDREIHVFDLVGATGADRSDTGPVIDADARADYERRITVLTEEIEEAERAGRDARAVALDVERAAIITHLAAALGLGGHARIAGSDIERARKAVGMRVRDACKRIDADLPELGRHLGSAIHTGTWCSYRPDTPTDWSL